MAVVGCGWWSTTAHLPALHASPGAKLAAIAEPDDGRRARAVARFAPDRAFADWRELLDDVELDALVVATPPGEHFPAAAAALERGINVLVEKPMVVHPAEGRRLLEIAARHGATLTVGYTFHYSAHVMRLREEIAAGRIGTVEHVSCVFASTARELYRRRPESYAGGDLGYSMTETPLPDTYADPAAGGGQAHSQLTHSAALVLHLTGLHPTRVSAFTSGFGLEVDLADALAVRFEGGAVGSLDSVGSVLPGQDEILQCRIFGDAGHVQLDAIRGTASVHGPDGEIEALPELAAEERYPLHGPVDDLLRVTRESATSRAPGTLGQEVVVLLDAALRSACRGGAAEAVGDRPLQTAR